MVGIVSSGVEALPAVMVPPEIIEQSAEFVPSEVVPYVSDAVAEKSAEAQDMPDFWEYTRANGKVERAESIEKAQEVCPVLGAMATKQATAMLRLSALGKRKMAEDAAPAKDAPAAAKPKATPVKHKPLTSEKAHTPGRTKSAEAPAHVERPPAPQAEAAPIAAVLIPDIVAGPSAVIAEAPDVPAKPHAAEDMPVPQVRRPDHAAVTEAMHHAGPVEPLAIFDLEPFVMQQDEQTAAPMPVFKLAPPTAPRSPARKSEAQQVQSTVPAVLQKALPVTLPMAAPISRPFNEAVNISYVPDVGYELTMPFVEESMLPEPVEPMEYSAMPEALSATAEAQGSSAEPAHEDITELLPAIILLPPVEQSSIQKQVSDGELLPPASAEATEPEPGTEPAPPIAIAVAERLAAAPPEAQLLTQPITEAITETIRLLQVTVVRESVPPAEDSAVVEQLETLVIALLETSGVPYEPDDVKAFVCYLIQVNTRPLLERHVGDADLEHDGTHEAKHHFALRYAYSADEDEVPRNVRAIIALLHRSMYELAA